MTEKPPRRRCTVRRGTWITTPRSGSGSPRTTTAWCGSCWRTSGSSESAHAGWADLLANRLREGKAALQCRCQVSEVHGQTESLGGFYCGPPGLVVTAGRPHDHELHQSGCLPDVPVNLRLRGKRSIASRHRQRNRADRRQNLVHTSCHVRLSNARPLRLRTCVRAGEQYESRPLFDLPSLQPGRGAVTTRWRIRRKPSATSSRQENFARFASDPQRCGEEGWS